MKDLKTALALMETGQAEEAYELLKAKVPETSDEEKFVIVEIFEEWGYFDDAIDVITQLLDRYPEEGQLITKLAHFYIELEEDERAIDLLNQVAEDDPFYVHSLLLLADLYEREGLLEVSEQKLLEAKNYVSDEEMYIIDFALAELYLTLGQAQKAIVFYEKVLEVEKELNGILIEQRLAESYTLQGAYEKALRYYDRLQLDDPNELFQHAFVAERAQEHNRAIQLWNKIIELDPHYHPVYYELAKAYEHNNKLNKAYEIAQKGLKYDEFNKRLYFLIGKLALKLDKEEEAIESLQEAIALDEDYKEAILLLTDVYEQQQNYEEIVQFLTYIKKIGGADPVYDWKLATAYNELEQYERAKELFEDAYFHLQEDSSFLKEYGFFLIEEGERERGTEILTKYTQLIPEDEETIAFLERIHFSNEDEI
ncbi:MAG TPA: tetratricopeptide repeat protein [Pseudogracilibacillus sp.]|nr:tetratricopeptide repeat protein [Pseudogracilibacillus sp.]